MAETQAFSKEPGLLSLNVRVKACNVTNLATSTPL